MVCASVLAPLGRDTFIYSYQRVLYAMEHLSGRELIGRLVRIAIVFWSILIIPLLIMIFLVLTGHGNILSHDEASWRVLYYNLLFAPVLIIVSCLLSWLMLKREKFVSALAFASLPLLILFVELIAADIALWLL